jgi:hypothetical protein
MNMLHLFKPGDVIYGYCNGRFGGDDYKTKTCVAVRPQYAVFEYEDGSAAVLNLRDLLSGGRFSAEEVRGWVRGWFADPGSGNDEDLDA